MSRRRATRPQKTKGERRREQLAKAQASLFTPTARCPATREAVARYSCPLCGRPPEDHDPEDADVVRDDGGDFAAWMLSLPRSPS
jgi:hypothetical protein